MTTNYDRDMPPRNPCSEPHLGITLGSMNATYSCGQCGMSVKAQCAKCDVPLENGHLDLPDGSQVQVSRCPSCEGKIKSPQCCGADMACSV